MTIYGFILCLVIIIGHYSRSLIQTFINRNDPGDFAEWVAVHGYTFYDGYWSRSHGEKHNETYTTKQLYKLWKKK